MKKVVFENGFIAIFEEFNYISANKDWNYCLSQKAYPLLWKKQHALNGGDLRDREIAVEYGLDVPEIEPIYKKKAGVAVGGTKEEIEKVVMDATFKWSEDVLYWPIFAYDYHNSDCSCDGCIEGTVVESWKTGEGFKVEGIPSDWFSRKDPRKIIVQTKDFDWLLELPIGAPVGGAPITMHIAKEYGKITNEGILEQIAQFQKEREEEEKKWRKQRDDMEILRLKQKFNIK